MLGGQPDWDKSWVWSQGVKALGGGWGRWTLPPALGPAAPPPPSQLVPSAPEVPEAGSTAEATRQAPFGLTRDLFKATFSPFYLSKQAQGQPRCKGVEE